MTSATTAGGYRVAPDRLDTAAGELDTRAGALAAAKTALDGENVPAAAFGGVSASSPAAASYQRMIKELAGRLGDQVTRARTIQSGLGACATGYRRADVQVAAMYRALLPEDPLPSAGSASGASGRTGAWAGAIADNRTKVADALTAERNVLTQLKADHADAGALARSQHRISLYEDILANDRQILRFDPAGTGRIAELVGQLRPGTRNVGLFVPGINTSFDNFQDYADLGKSLTGADPTGRTAMVVWADGEFPQGLGLDAASATMAQKMAPDLKAFGDELQQQIHANAGDGVIVTGVPHSYGGDVMGTAETLGLKVDRMLYVEGAGMGHGVWSPADLPASQAGIQRFSMTAPLDPIETVQGNTRALEWVSNFGHGADPDTFPGVTQLETGRDASGAQQWGYESHSGVLKPGSDSWNNIYQVITGGATTPEGSFQPRGIGEALVEGINQQQVIPRLESPL
ncbi:alpha/beta hydrolase [Amycolatopsis sp. H20-H5]|uniref:alpha/beta hydrolase n=1 Tax=Amycolatopsis sp. H20-H5 TaxID=3046309 RepID=UPI002DC0574C|nr:alpha/beta hydrolase [Amycolatopsis sp. H20-H5]MEC3978341.1 alpha/beta hydrolase [Amycolatopsis sp. H20-H5]